MTQAVALAQYGSTGVSQGFKNRIINGAMVIDQRNAGASVTPTDGQYTLDRWRAYGSGASKYSVQQDAGAVTPPAGFSDYLGVTSLAATTVGSSDYYMIRQVIEGYNIADLDFGKSTAKTVTLSFWVRSSLTGTFGGSLENNAGTYSYPFSYTISAANTWEQKSVTITGQTAGVWNSTNTGGFLLQFSLGVGSTYRGTANAWVNAERWSVTGETQVVATNGATWYLTGVQLEVGSTATSFDYRDYTTELQLCQRYFQVRKYSGDWACIWTGDVNTGNSYFYCEPFPVVMRAAPSGVVTDSNTDGFNTPGFTRTMTSGMAVNAASNQTAARRYFQFNYTVSAEL
jgi:hypothetical protein